MGLRGAGATTKADRRRPVDDSVISDEAVAIYLAMRAHEQEQGGPGGDEWWDLNKQLAKCLGLFGGVICYEDPEWQSSKFFQEDIDRFHRLERAAQKAKQKFKFKWER
jgi:hypothetical protein